MRLEALEGRLVLAAPTAVADSYTAIGGATLNVPAAGVLANDSDPEGDLLQASLVSGASNGTLNLSSNGSFSYTPNPGFVGDDTFTYRAVADPSIVFTVDQSQSNVNVTATVTVAGVGSRTDNDTTRLSGTVVARLSPTTSPFVTAQIADLDLTLVDSLDFSFNYIVANLTANAAAGSMHVTMETPGPAANVAAGSFTQVGNDLRVTGQANLACSSVLNLCPALPPNPQIFDNAGIVTDITGALSQVGSTITLTFPVNFVGTFDLGDGNSLDLTLAGSVRATGQASPPPEQSNIATVTITSLPQIATQGETYHVLEDHQLSVLASPPLRNETLLPRGSLWRYLDDGSNQGTAWRATAFNDTAWKGPSEAEFGYGDGGEGTVIICDPDPTPPCAENPNLNDNYITSYFRRDVVLDQVDDIHELLVRLRRDDGAAVYVNGVEVARDNLAAGAAFDTPALTTAADDGVDYFEFTAPADMLVVGRNVIAVEVHQVDGGSSDVSFDLELVARRGNLGPLANDVNNAGGPLFASIFSRPAHGTLSFNSAGTFVYTPDADFSGPDSFTYLAAESSTPIVVSRGTIWNYLGDGSNQGTAWRAAAFDDAAWPQGRGELGYGDGDEATVVACDANPADGCIESPTDLGDNYITTYFRHKFEIDDVNHFTQPLTLHVVRDDGVAIFINGVELGRDNLAAGAAFDTPANVAIGGGDESTPITFSVPVNLLSNGINTLAVEVHQSSGGSSDISFDAWLTANPAAPSPQIVNLIVEAADDAPTASDDGPYSATGTTPLVVDAASGVLANDADLENNTLTAVLVSGPANGTLNLAANGGFTYTPTVAAADSFTYRATQSTTLVPLGSRWRIMDNGSDQGTAWRAAAFDDAAWSIGLGELGYGDGDETSLVRYGPSGSNKYITTYFRHAFDVADAAAVTDLVLDVIRDDGVAIYLNGVEVGRDNLAAGALFGTLAGPLTIGTAAESTPVSINVPAGLLINGRNVLAVEIHQAAADSSDISFDLELRGTLNSAAATASIESTGSTAGPRVTSVEVQNVGWSSDFRQFLQNNGLGSGGFAIPGGGDQLATLPWGGLSTIALDFSEFVDDANLISATLVGATTGKVMLDAPLTSEGPAGTLFAIWNVADGQTLAADRYTFTLFDTAHSTGGAALDGDWTTGESSFPSGNGAAGGDFVFEFRVLPGDVNRDATVGLADVAASVAAGFLATTDAGYSPLHDVDGNGAVNYVDAILVRNSIPSSVSSPSAAAIVAAASDRLPAPTRRGIALRAPAAVRAAAIDRAIVERESTDAGLSVARSEQSLSHLRPRGRTIARSVVRAETLGGPLD
ncbi:MAG: Ig-like domain-containing protein [Pirellulales bacterium]